MADLVDCCNEITSFVCFRIYRKDRKHERMLYSDRNLDSTRLARQGPLTNPLIWQGSVGYRESDLY